MTKCCGGPNMVRSFIYVVSDDHLLINRAQQFGLANQVSVKVMTQSEWETLTEGRSNAVPSLSAGFAQSATATEQGGQGVAAGSAKVLQFPNPNTAMGQAGRTPGMGNGVATIDQLESIAIENAIAAFKGNLTEAAKALGIGRATLYRKVKAYNLDPSQARRRKAA